MVAALAVAICAASAQAEPNAEWFEDASPAEQQGIVDYLYELSPQGSTPYTGESAVKEAEEITKAAAAEDPASPAIGDLAGGINSMEEGSGLIPSLADSVPYIAAAGTSFAIGWKIGEGINADFLHIGLSEGSAPDIATYEQFCYSQECGGALDWAPYGEHVYREATVQQKPGAYLYDGYLNGSGHWIGIRWFEPPCLFSLKNPPPGARMQTHLNPEANCWVGYTAPVYVEYPYILPSDLVRLALLHRYNPLDGEPSHVTPAPKDPGTAEVEEATAEVIDSSTFMQEWLDYVREPENYPDPLVTETKNDHRCDRSPGPLYENPGGNGTPEPFAKRIEAPFTVANKPEGFKEAEVFLRWGMTDWEPSRESFEDPVPYRDLWGGWGYRHILAKHGWSALDQEETALALSLSVPEETTKATKFVYEVPEVATGVGGVPCTRVVVVDFGTQAGDPSPRGIVTSFNKVG
jgi:hypothetical protein